ncbi:MAG: amino acid permease, partial [Eggerthellaceae bacterium]|nr:amino acid permease [Eggerthellaceae bacterium]
MYPGRPRNRRFRRLANLAGGTSLAVVLLFLVIMVFYLFNPDPSLHQTQISLDAFNPFNEPSWLNSICVLVLALGGLESLSPYTTRSRSARSFRNGIILIIALTTICNIFGTLLLGLIFSPDE